MLKAIKGYEGLYEISPMGKVFSYKSKKQLKLQLGSPIGRQDYFSVKLYKNGKSTRYKIHRLVAQAFILNPFNKLQVNHIDGNKQNNNDWNLEWVTSSEQSKHAYRIGLSDRKGEAHPQARLTNDDVIAIRNFVLTKKYNQIELSKKYGVNKQNISNIILRKTWTHI